MSAVFDISKWARPNVLLMKPYASARDEYTATGDDTILLDANENPFETEVNRYPDPYQNELRAELAKQRGVTAEQVFLGNGSDEVLDLLFRAFCEPRKDAILTMPPTFGMFKVLAALNQVEQIEIPLMPDFTIDTEAVLAAIPANCKMILLCSPNNPTGNSFSRNAIQALLKGFEGLVVVDEAYVDFSPEKSWIDQLEAYPNLVITQTLSKAYGQAGIRLGMAFAQPAIVNLLQKIKLPYNVNALTQRWALERLRQPEAIQEEVDTLLKEKEGLYQSFKNIPWISTAFPSDTNFILVRVDNGDLRYRQLMERGVVVRNRSNQMHCANTLRISVGTPEENTSLKQILKDIS